jgi:fibronectin-binding autotransporter adhesin
MKPRLSFPLAAAIAALLAASPPQAHAIVFFWDANGAGAAGTGGTGNWNITAQLWRSGSATGTASLWTNTFPNADEARLTSTAGTVTLNAVSTDLNVNTIRFGSAGYIIAAPTTGTAKLVLAGTNPTIAVGNVGGTILADISGDGLRKESGGAGGGTLVLGGNNSFGSGTMTFGVLNIDSGYIRLTSNKALGNYTNIALAAGATAVNGLEVAGGVNAAYNILTSGRGNPTTIGYALKNVSGDNTWSGNLTASGPGGGYGILSDAGTLTISGGITASYVTTTRTFDFAGAGDFSMGGSITDGAATVAVAKGGAGTLTLTGNGNTYTGNTTVTAGTLTLASTGQLKFITGAISGEGHNSISGAGSVNLDGAFVIDTAATDATDLTSGTWQIEDVTSLTGAYGSTFTVVDWTDAGNHTWTKTVGAKSYTFNETTGSVTLGGSDYDGWAASFPGFTNNLPAQDHDGDGQLNQQEYAFGLNPTSAASANPITVPLDKTTGKFSYTRRATPATSGLVYTIKTSTTLSGWITDSGATESVTGTVGEVQTVEVTLTPALLSQAKLFIRVEAE